MLTPIARTVYFFITRVQPKGCVLLPVDDPDELPLHNLAAVLKLGFQHGDMRIIIFDLVGVPLNERRYFITTARKIVNGELGSIGMPHFIKSRDVYMEEE